MLSHLRIQNLAIITDCELNLGLGFSVLTGETGAGKSIIVDAISLLMGQPSSEDWIQSGQEWASIEGTFILENPPESLASYLEPGDPLIIFRKISRKKDNICRINNQTVTLKTLKSAMAEIINIIGQHEHMHLLSPDKQLQWLDAMSSKIPTLKAQYTDQFQVWKAHQKTLSELQTQHHDLAQRKEFLAFQCQDIASHDFKPGEEDHLNDIRKALQNHHKISQLHSTALSHLDTLQAEEGQLSKALLALSAFDPQLATLIDKLAPFSDSLNEMHHQLSLAAQNNQQLDAQNIDDVEARLDTIFKVKTKYHQPSLEALLDHYNTLQIQLDQVENNDDYRAKVEAQRDTARATLNTLGNTLRSERQATAKTLIPTLVQALTELHFTQPQFDIVFIPLETPQDTGLDAVSFTLSPNPGEPLKPLAKIASGGELSRIMLAIKTIFSMSNPVPTLIFDEIDTGIGGLTANKIGNFLHRIAEQNQVFCITHLPQIARLADHHYQVTKTVQDKRTHTQVQSLSPTEIKAELHRMVGGEIVLSQIRA